MHSAQQKRGLTAKVQTLKASHADQQKGGNIQKKDKPSRVDEGNVKQKHLPNKIKPEVDKNELIRNVENAVEGLSNKMDFEKEILMQPNDVELWIKYITFTFETE